MKHKLMLGFILSSVLSANSFALEIHGGKLISHKEWTKGNVIKSSSKEINPSAALKTPYHNFQQNEASNQITAHSMTLSFQGTSIPVNTDTTFRGVSFVQITNDTAEQKTYVITSYVDAQPPCSISSQCSLIPIVSEMSQDIVMLDPKGGVEILKEDSMTTSFDVAGYASHSAGVSVWDSTTSTAFNTSGVNESIIVTDTKK